MRDLYNATHSECRDTNCGGARYGPATDEANPTGHPHAAPVSGLQEEILDGSNDVTGRFIASGVRSATGLCAAEQVSFVTLISRLIAWTGNQLDGPDAN